MTSRRAVRGFADQPVPREVLDACCPLRRGRRPDRIFTVEHLCGDRRTAGRDQDAPSSAWPTVTRGTNGSTRCTRLELESPFQRAPIRLRQGAYSALGIAREDWEARQRAAIANWNCFGAPAALFCYIHRDLGVAQWADVGMYLQTVMLLLQLKGCTGARRWRGRRFGERLRRSCHLRTG